MSPSMPPLPHYVQYDYMVDLQLAPTDPPNFYTQRRCTLLMHPFDKTLAPHGNIPTSPYVRLISSVADLTLDEK